MRAFLGEVKKNWKTENLLTQISTLTDKQKKLRNAIEQNNLDKWVSLKYL